MSELSKNEQIREEELVLDYRDIIRIASGLDADGYPNASAVLAIDSIEEADQISQVASIAFGKAVIDIFANGGCAVVQADFGKDDKFAYSRAVAIAGQWMENMHQPDYENKLLSLVVVPMPIGGLIYIVYRGLVYFTSVDIDQQTNRLIMCFDNACTQILEDEELDINEVSNIVQAELSRQEKEAEMEYLTAQEEYEKAKQENEYREFMETHILSEQDEEVKEEDELEEEDFNLNRLYENRRIDLTEKKKK